MRKSPDFPLDHAPPSAEHDDFAATGMTEREAVSVPTLAGAEGGNEVWTDAGTVTIFMRCFRANISFGRVSVVLVDYFVG